jgi:hypothetical protein
MQLNGKKEVIINFATDRLENFEKCLSIGFCFNEIIKITIINFLRELKHDLRKSLNNEAGWEICGNPVYGDITDNPFSQYNGLFITKNIWNKKFFIGICAEKSMARDIIIGVYRGGEKITQRVDGKLIDRLNAEYKHGSNSDYWEWWRFLDGDYRSWDNEEILIKIFEKKELVGFIKKQILEIKEIAAPLIDAEMRINKNMV